MIRLTALLGVLAAGFLLFYGFALTPSPASASAPASQFSAGRAMADIRVMGTLPHPVGSAADAAVRDYLMRRMSELGLNPRVQSAISWRAERSPGRTYVWGARVDNVIGVLPGRDPTLPAIALMAHHDSVPGSPGAADDTTGVADALEIVRAVEASGQPERDVMLVITDGEEADLNGAVAFFKIDPLARRVGFVFNLEARGGGGRAAMFETGPNNGAVVRTFLASSKGVLANSLTEFIYKLLPNDTDYTVAKAVGIPGLNFAFIGREFDYHSPSSTVEALDQGAVQHMGEEVLGPVRAMANAAQLPARAPDVVYGNLVGDVVVAYPTWVGWIVLLGIAAALLAFMLRARAAGEFDWPNLARGLGGAILILAASALTLHLTRRLTGVGIGWMEGRALLARFPPFEAAMALAGLAAVLTVAIAMARGPARLAGVLLAAAGALIAVLTAGIDGVALAEASMVAVLSLLVLGGRVAFAPAWLGLLSAAFLLAFGLQIAAPTTAFVIAWPLAAGALVALAVPLGKGWAWRWILALALMVLVAAWCGALIHNLLEAMDLPELPVLPVWLASLSLWPLMWPARRSARRVGGLATLTIVGAFGVALWLHFTSPWSERYPRAAEPLYVVDEAAHRAWKASPLDLDPWTRSVLSPDGGKISPTPIATYRRTLWAAPAPYAPAPSPNIRVARAANGAIVLFITMDPRTDLRLDLRASAPASLATLENQPAPWLLTPGQWTHIEWMAAPGLAITFNPTAAGALDIRYAAFTPGWPTGVTPLSPMPPTLMAWDKSGDTVATGALRSTW